MNIRYSCVQEIQGRSFFWRKPIDQLNHNRIIWISGQRHHSIRVEIVFLLFLASVPNLFLAAQELVPPSPFPPLGMPWTIMSVPQAQNPVNQWSYPPDGYFFRPQEGSDQLDPSQGPYKTDAIPRKDGWEDSSYRPNLTGIWQGSGGERVEIVNNQARIWGGRIQSCKCVFLIVGERLIAYSPDTDVVRKYYFSGNEDRFSLIDEDGYVMTFWRVR